MSNKIGKYNPLDIENRWQQRWLEEGVYKPDLSKQNKYYSLAEFAYPSGDLHIGHWFTFCGADILARYKRMQGFNIFFPNGFDAFGLPAENAAIKRGVHPSDWTTSNIERMKKQFYSMGASFSFDHEVITCQPEYYHWNQWLFLQLLKKGLVYRGKLMSNWCETCQTVLANEGVEAGTCWRCHNPVVMKEVEQWFFKITAYADKLLWLEEDKGIDWPKSVKQAQNEWIGRSKGIIIKFAVAQNKQEVNIFTTRMDTIYGATFLVLAPEHPIVSDILNGKTTAGADKVEELDHYVEMTKRRSELERKESKEKTGVFAGLNAVNPINKQEIPIWVSDYVLPGYGTGAIMAVPAHDQRDLDFARKFDLKIQAVIAPKDQVNKFAVTDKSYEGLGILINSDSLNGQTSQEAKQKISDSLEEHHLGFKTTYYHLHDWSISRQRYWGTPIPIIYCKRCWENKSEDEQARAQEGVGYIVKAGTKWAVVLVPETDLPVELPYNVDYTPTGKPPLATNEEWLKVKCPVCQGEAERDAETMDTFVDSSWYFFRYLDPHLKTAPFDRTLAAQMMPVDIYFGGAEHTLGHTLYSRFITKFFQDLGLIDFGEYALKRVNHGVILGPDGYRMSKSRGNVVNPDEEVKKYGADAVRTYLAFLMPYTSTGPWISDRIWGPYRFLERVWTMFSKIGDSELSEDDLVAMNQTIKKVGEDIESISFNTAVAALMSWINYLSGKEKVSEQEYKTFMRLLAPFAPHMTEELWHLLGQSGSIHHQKWPTFDSKYLKGLLIWIAVQINGKLRDEVSINRDLAQDQQRVEQVVLQSQKVKQYIGEKTVKKVIYVPDKIINLVVE